MYYKLYLIVLFIIHVGIVTAQSIEIRCERPMEMHNNKVGSDWTFGYELKNQYYLFNSSLSVSLKDASLVNYFAREDDDVFPEEGIKNLGIDPTRMEWNKEYTKDIEVTVTEIGGQFAGNTAAWNVKIFYKKIQDKS